MEQSIKPQRINVVDSLRGFAVVGILSYTSLNI